MWVIGSGSNVQLWVYPNLYILTRDPKHQALTSGLQQLPVSRHPISAGYKDTESCVFRG